MENEKIAELISKSLYSPTNSEIHFAFQLFVERFVVPIDVCWISEMEKWILDALNKRDQAIEWQRNINSNERERV